MSMSKQQPIAGYVRSGVIHDTDEWRFEVEGEQERIAYLVAETDDGPVQFALGREGAVNLLRSLELFLLDQPGARSRT